MHQLVNFFPLGRSVDEAMRMVDALQYFEKKVKFALQTGPQVKKL
jgi:alkyl hydroperoxide reductase subunit AhpC